MSATSCKTDTSWVLPLTPLDRITTVWLTVGRQVSVALSHGWLWKWDHIQKDASSAGNSPGINFKQTAHYLFCYLTIGVTKSSLSKDLGQSFLTWETLSHHVWSCRFWLNCFLVLSYINILRHALVQGEDLSTPGCLREVRVRLYVGDFQSWSRVLLARSWRNPRTVHWFPNIGLIKQSNIHSTYELIFTIHTNWFSQYTRINFQRTQYMRINFHSTRELIFTVHTN